MTAEHDLVLPPERFPASWTLASTAALAGTVDFAFTSGDAPPDGTAVWYPGTWADTNGAASTRTAQLVVAGSAVTPQAGDAHPGVGDFTAWVRHTDASGYQRVRNGGVLRFR